MLDKIKKYYTDSELRAMSIDDLLFLEKRLDEQLKQNKISEFKEYVNDQRYVEGKGYLLSDKEINMLENGETPDSLFIPGEGWTYHCEGEGGLPPCYWSPPDYEPPPYVPEAECYMWYAINYGQDCSQDGYDCDSPNCCCEYWTEQTDDHPAYPFNNYGCEIGGNVSTSYALGGFPNDVCPNGFVCTGTGGTSQHQGYPTGQYPTQVCCQSLGYTNSPFMGETYGGWSSGGYTHQCLTGGAGNPKPYCGWPGARNYNPYAHYEGFIPSEFYSYGGNTIPADHPVPTPYEHDGSHCKFCDPLNELGYGANWDCESFCADADRWSPVWSKGDTNKDLETNVLDIVQYLPYILGDEDFSHLTSSEKACLLWALDVNDDHSIDLLDIIGIVNDIMNETYKFTSHTQKVMTMNVGHLGYIPYNNIRYADSLGTFPNTHVDCVGNKLARREDELQIANLINQQRPDILILTEVLSDEDCVANYFANEDNCRIPVIGQNEDDFCLDVENAFSGRDTWSSCSPALMNHICSSEIAAAGINPHPPQIERLLPNGYSYTCNEFAGDGTWENFSNKNTNGAGTTCIAVRNNQGYAIEEEMITLQPPSECFDQDEFLDSGEPNPNYGNSLIDWENISYAQISKNDGLFKVVAAHPMNARTLKDDKCRKAAYQQLFNTTNTGGVVQIPDVEPILLAGDFNNDPYRFNWQYLWNMGNPLQQDWLGAFVEYMLDKWSSDYVLHNFWAGWTNSTGGCDNGANRYLYNTISFSVDDVTTMIFDDQGVPVDPQVDNCRVAREEGICPDDGSSDYYEMKIFITLNAGFDLNFASSSAVCFTPSVSGNLNGPVIIRIRWNSDGTTPSFMTTDFDIDWDIDGDSFVENLFVELLESLLGFGVDMALLIDDGGKNFILKYIAAKVIANILIPGGFTNSQQLSWFDGISAEEFQEIFPQVPAEFIENILENIIMNMLGIPDPDDLLDDWVNEQIADNLDISDLYSGVLSEYLPLTYGSILNMPQYDYIDSSEFWHRHLSPTHPEFEYPAVNYKVLNVPEEWDYNNSSYLYGDLFNQDNAPQETHRWGPLNGTLDYIISNYATNQQCEIIDPFIENAYHPQGTGPGAILGENLGNVYDSYVTSKMGSTGAVITDHSAVICTFDASHRVSSTLSGTSDGNVGQKIYSRQELQNLDIDELYKVRDKLNRNQQELNDRKQILVNQILDKTSSGKKDIKN